MKQTKKVLLLCALSATLSACGFFDKDNTPTPTPLTSYPTEAKVHYLWSTRTGFGVDGDYLRLSPSISDKAVFTANRNGAVVATDKETGSNLWVAYTKKYISAGPTAADDLVIVGTRGGDVIALKQTDGSTQWKTNVSTEVLATPAVDNHIVIVKSIDGNVTALSENDGHKLWEYHETEPTIILRGGSAPQMTHDSVVVGFANGSLAKLTQREGSLLWRQTVAEPEGAFAIQRMVDIDANPLVSRNKIYVATYQGKIAALDLSTGRQSWSHDISSYSGLTADDSTVYLSDAKSNVTAYDADSGTSTWRQTKLDARNITGPVLMNDYIVVGDEQGYLHWLNKADGHFAARVRVGGFGIITTPVVNNNVLYVVTKDGHLAAYTLS